MWHLPCRDISALDPGPPSSLPTDPDTKVDISSLTWEDKERVLRLLFAKINNVQVGSLPSACLCLPGASIQPNSEINPLFRGPNLLLPPAKTPPQAPPKTPHIDFVGRRSKHLLPIPPLPPAQGYVEATPEHPLEAASAAAFASSVASGSGGSGDHDDGLSSQGGPNSRTFVTQANTAAARAAVGRSSLEQLSERDIGGAPPEGGGGGGGGGSASGRLGSPPLSFTGGGVSHQPQAPSIVW